MLLDRLFGRFRRREIEKKEERPLSDLTEENQNEQLDANNPFPDIVTIEFRDVIDLHSIPARQVRAVVEDYIEEAHRRGVRWVRIIHGKGIGVQREMVRSILSRSSYVVDFQDAPGEAGGWGATIVTLNADDGKDNR